MSVSQTECDVFNLSTNYWVTDGIPAAQKET